MPTGVASRRTAACLLAVTLVASERASLAADLPSISGLLDRYRSGAFDAAVRELATVSDSEAVRTAFIQGASEWIGREPADAANRRLVATALAVELAQARLVHDNVSLIVLMDWATKEWKKGPPSRAERVWTLAAVALAERGGREALPPSVDDRQWGQTFINDAVKRFPDEPRLLLAKTVFGVPIFSSPSRRTRSDLEKLAADPVVGPEALLQLAYLELAALDYQATLGFARRAADLARGPAVVYFAHFFMALCHEFQARPADAVAAYAAALRAVPHAQSAAIPLAILLLRDNQAGASFDLIDRSLAERPEGDDPWRLFVYGGYVRWPLLTADLRKEIR